MSQKLILFIALSLDGYVADAHGQINWLESGLPQTEPDTRYTTFLESIETVVLGRKTFDQIMTELSPDAYPYFEKDSIIFTHRPPASAPPRCTFVQEDIVSAMIRLKAQDGRGIWLVGGPSLISPLIAANLIDEYQLTYIPRILGTGLHLTELGLPNLAHLQLVEHTALNNLLYTRYQP